MTEPVLEIADLHAAYGKVEVLHGLNLRAMPGEIVTMIGPNGAGKSTLLNAIGGALPIGASARGKLLFNGQDIAAMPIDHRVALGLCLVPERRELFGSMSVLDNLVLGSWRRYKLGERDHADQLQPVFDLFPRLAERRAQIASTLSGGERQMLAIGRALMAQPRVLLLDEPSLGLAPLIVKEIFHIIRRLKETGVTIVLVEQNARAALQVADQAYVLETGSVMLEGPARDLVHDPRVVETYLGLARTR